MPTTVVNVRYAIPGTYIYVGRAMTRSKVVGVSHASPFGNPWKAPMDGTVAEVLARYRAYVLASPELMALLPSLRGKALGCWCCTDRRDPPFSPEKYVCHAQILAELADACEGEG